MDVDRKLIGFDRENEIDEHQIGGAQERLQDRQKPSGHWVIRLFLIKAASSAGKRFGPKAWYSKYTSRHCHG